MSDEHKRLIEAVEEEARAHDEAQQPLWATKVLCRCGEGFATRREHQRHRAERVIDRLGIEAFDTMRVDYGIPLFRIRAAEVTDD